MKTSAQHRTRRKRPWSRADSARKSPAGRARVVRGIIVALGLFSLAAWPAVPALSPSPPAELLQRLTLCAHPALLSHLRMHAVETWMNRKGEAYSDQDSEVDRVFFYRGVEMEQARSRNGKLVSPEGRQRQQENFSGLKSKIDRHWSGPEDAGRMLNIDGEIWTLPQIVALYHWTQSRGPVTGGIPTVRLRFAPNPRIQPGSRVQHLLLSVRGHLDVDPETGQIVAGAFESTGPVKFGLGLLARFDHLQGTFDLQRTGAAWVYHHIQVEVDGRELWTHMHGAEVMTYTIDGVPPAPATPNGQITQDAQQRRK